MWSESEQQRQTQLLRQLGLPVSLNAPVKSQEMLQAMQSDKKTEYGSLRLILPSDIGKVEIVSGVPEGDVIAAIDANRAVQS
jgi:3-dehydroquinate synthase